MLRQLISKGSRIGLGRGGGARRWLHLHEYQSKELMATHGINTQRFVVASSRAEALAGVARLGVPEYVVKAQVLAGGRGKGTLSSGLQGGVHLAREGEEVGRLVELMVGHRLVTHQTDARGVPVHKVMIAEAKDLAMETYLAILLDRTAGGLVMVGSPQGGMDIEAVAQHSPHLIFKQIIDVAGPTEEQLRQMALNLGFQRLTEPVVEQAMEQMRRLHALFMAVDATLLEVNPFGVTPQGEVLCFDAKLNFDDNAAFRQAALFSQADSSDVDVRERKAQAHHLNYIGMEGNVGCLVNGAGLAMATMDILALHGGSPANFLDVGGSAQPDQISTAFSLLLDDDQVQSIFVNIFGGIVRCDLIAEGILRAVRSERVLRPVPLVVRLAGTNEQMAKERLRQEYPHQVLIYDDLDQAAQQAVAAAAQSTGPRPLLNQ